MKTAALSLIYPGYLFELMGKYMTGNTHVYALAPKAFSRGLPKGVENRKARTCNSFSH
jgi:hypothetical protein